MPNVRASIKNGMSPIHPGVILEKEFLLPLKVSASKLAAHIGVTNTRIYQSNVKPLPLGGGCE